METQAELREAKSDGEAFGDPQQWKAMTTPKPSGIRIASDTHQSPVMAVAVGDGLPNSSRHTQGNTATVKIMG